MKNYKGQEIGGIKKLKKLEFGTGKKDVHCQPEVEWVKFKDTCADCHGFDKRNTEANGSI